MKLTLLLASMVFMLGLLNVSAEGQEHTASVSVSAGRTVSLDVTVFDVKGRLFVPYCGTVEGGTPILCTGAVRLEVSDRDNWRPARLMWRGDGILGGVPPDRWKSRRINPKEIGNFIYRFREGLFAVKPGQRVRLVVYAWADERELRKGTQPILLEGEPFSLPKAE